MNPTHDDVGAAIGRLVELARGDTGGSRIAANFLLAWWDGDSWGHFPIADLFGLDGGNAADMTLIFDFLGQHSAIYADAWGYRDDMAELVELWRPEPATKPLTVADLDISVRLVNVLGPSSPADLIGEILDDDRHPLRSKLRATDIKHLAATRLVSA